VWSTDFAGIDIEEESGIDMGTASDLGAGVASAGGAGSDVGCTMGVGVP